MDAKTLLALDMSTTCTGFALFDIAERKLLKTGKLKPSTKGGVNKMTYPRQQLTKMIDLGNQIKNLIEQEKPTSIVIEEIAGSKNRMGQKTLDGFHFVVAWIIQDYLDIVAYQDVTGSAGWRTGLQLRLSDADKHNNKEAKKLNKKLAAAQRLPVVGPKHLAARFANAVYQLELDVDECETDADVADAVSMGHFYMTYRLK